MRWGRGGKQEDCTDESEALELLKRLKVRLECGGNVSTEGKGKTSLANCVSIMYEVFHLQKTNSKKEAITHRNYVARQSLPRVINLTHLFMRLKHSPNITNTVLPHLNTLPSSMSSAV